MLFGNLSESESDDDGDWTVSLPEDHPDPMRIILNIIHGYSELVPQELDTIQELYEVVALADKYGTIRFLRFWVSTWIGLVGAIVSPSPPQAERKPESPRLRESLLHATYISWKLGHETYFTRAMREVCLRHENSDQVLSEFEAVKYFGALEYIGMYTCYLC